MHIYVAITLSKVRHSARFPGWETAGKSDYLTDDHSFLQFPMLVGDKVPRDEKCRKSFLLLLTICSTVLAPVINCDTANSN